MRDFSKVSAAFWTGKTGRAIRGDAQTQIVALYLLTSPHANMIGVFQCPILYIAHETGSPLEGASKGLRRLEQLGFCTFDEATETVWVHEMARFQIGDALAPKDKQVFGVQKKYAALADGPIKTGFFAKYGAAYHLTEEPPKTPENKGSKQAPSEPLASPFEGPSKPGEGEGEGDRERIGASAPPVLQLVTDLSPAPASPPDVEFYRRGKEVLGNSSGGYLRKLLAAHKGNLALARAALEVASTKHDPKAYLGGVVKSRERDSDLEQLRLRGEAW